MKWFRVAAARLRGLLRPDAVRHDIDEELRFHVEMETETNIERGMAPDEARRQALRSFGNVGHIKDLAHEVKGGGMLETLWQDLRYGTRGLLKNPAFTLVTVGTLALGIGANVAMFGVIDTLLLRQPSLVRDAEDVVRVYGKGNWTAPTRSYPDYLDLRDGTNSFAAVAAYQSGSYDFGRGADARQVKGQRVTQSFFPLLGIRPGAGRFFTTAEDGVAAAGGAAAPVVVLGHAFWRNQFAADPHVLGREVRLGDAVYTVIGVTPKDFNGVDLGRVDIWLPLGERPEWRTDRGNYGAVNVIARLKAGVGVAAAEREANTVNMAGYARDGVKQETEAMALGPLQRGRGPSKPLEVRVAQWLAAVSAVVLLIACANAANLLLTRGLRRRREIAVRLALGASRTRLVRQLLTESLALAALAGAAALLLAFVIAPLIRSLVLPDDVAALGGVIDARVLAFTAAAALLCSVACGIFPAVQSSRPDLNVALKAGADRQSAGRWNTRSALVVGQIALTFVLLIGAGLFVRSFRNVSHINLGMDAERLLVVNVNLGGVGYKPEEAEAFYRRLLERAKTVPGVEHASAVHSVPFQSSWRTRFYVPGRDPEVWGDAGGGRFNHLVNFVTADFFRTTGTAVLRGRSFTEAERAGSLPVAIVNESLARRIWPGEEALGKCVKVLSADAQCAEVVGVAADTRMESLFEERSEQYYLPLDQPRRGEGTSALLIRTRIDPVAMIETVRRELQTLAADLPCVNVQPLAASVEPQARPWRLGVTAFLLFGALALALAVSGLYGVMAYAVAQRTREIGIRMALGAPKRNVLRLVIKQGMMLALVGVMIGLAGALALTRVMSNLLYGVSATDPATFIVVAALLALVAFLACTIPARRATKVDPLVALRHE